ncbi:hypothetical protein JZ751_013638 [Albula glossodonta]|uniref:Uncharacterized protein n=1 Tax=Albula glossodonta TaxID=121402 RepID=A0A8T2P1E8_9TELE|nr:hypothetical protein JZ751_013638 [Albula glossodonta]
MIVLLFVIRFMDAGVELILYGLSEFKSSHSPLFAPRQKREWDRETGLLVGNGLPLGCHADGPKIMYHVLSGQMWNRGDNISFRRRDHSCRSESSAPFYSARPICMYQCPFTACQLTPPLTAPLLYADGPDKDSSGDAAFSWSVGNRSFSILGIMTNCDLSVSTFTLNSRPARFITSSLVHLWYPRRYLGSSCRTEKQKSVICRKQSKK